VALLSWVASTGKVVTGLLYLFVFACGLGLLFVVIGTLAGAFTALPKSGGWMERVKHFFGFIMIAAAYYFARPFIPEDWFILAVGFGFLATAGVFGAFTRLEDHSDFIARTTKAIATFLLIAGVFYTWLGLAKFQGLASAMTGGLMVSSSHVTASPAAPEHKTGVQWLHTSPEEALQMAKSSGKPLMIDFWAEWCAACKELDHKTFSKPEVSDLINSRFIPLKVDGTKITPELKAIWASYGVKGLPTVVFLKGDGAEVERFEAFRTVEETMPVLKRVLGG
jgi:thiol:disulfide interchange protein DsbD